MNLYFGFGGDFPINRGKYLSGGEIERFQKCPFPQQQNGSAKERRGGRRQFQFQARGAKAIKLLRMTRTTAETEASSRKHYDAATLLNLFL